MNRLFYLNDIEIDEPRGFEALEFSLKRDDKWHGMVYEASTSALVFYGAAFTYLKEQKETYGVRANVIFTTYVTCGTYDYELELSGRLNFGKYKDSCGDNCTVSIPLEQDSCELIFKSRYDQKVDMDAIVAVDGMTPLEDYAGLAAETELTAHNLRVATEGFVQEGGEQIALDIFPPADTNDFTLRPTYSRELSANIDESQLVPSVFAASDNGLNDSVISPVALIEGEIDCFDGDFSYEVRLKGSYDFEYTGAGSDITVVRLVVSKGEYPSAETFLHQQDLAFTPNEAVGAFDFTFTGTTPLNLGDGFYVYFRMTGTNGIVHVLTGSVTFDEETYVKLEAVKSCPATNAELYMVHEALSRAVEAVTNRCMRVKSSYYGRTDSEPFSFDDDGCGGLRSVTSGLKIRRAEQDKFFASPKDLLEGLNAIDNIGIGFEADDTIPNAMLMRVEALDFFYQDREILRHNAVAGETEIEEMRHYSRIDAGYKKWEVENVNGLDEIHSTRQYNTSIDTINSPLDITSNLIAGSYPIEITRQQSFADTGAADTKYDNDTFIISMQRSDYPYGNIEVEKGNITNPANIFSPDTIYNYRLSPIRNLMRWYKTIAAGFASLSDSSNKLFFSSGTGNLEGYGLQTGTDCRIEAAELQENQNLFVTHFANTEDYTPLWKNETITYEYPMSYADYKTVKADPYAYISVQCGSADFLKYWIKEIKFRIAKGRATFVLRRKYSQ